MRAIAAGGTVVLAMPPHGWFDYVLATTTVLLILVME